MVTLFVREPPVKPPPPDKGGGIITGDGDGPSAGLLVGAAGPAADGSTRAAAVAGAMLGVLAAVASLVWALYNFKPLLTAASVGSPTKTGPPAAVDQTQGNQETPLLSQPQPTTENGLLSAASAPVDVTDAQPRNVQTTNVDLANYFSPMKTTANSSVQVDLDSGAGDGVGWTATSALMSRSSFEEVTKSRSGGLSGGGGAGAMSVGTQTANLQADTAGQGSAAGTAMFSTYSYASRTVSDTTRDLSQVRKSSAFCRLLLEYFHCSADVPIVFAVCGICFGPPLNYYFAHGRSQWVLRS